MKFDVTKNPPSLVELEQARSEAEARAANLLRLGRWGALAGYSKGWVDDVIGILPLALALALALAVVATLAGAVAVAGALALALAVVGAVALAGVLGYGFIVEILSVRRSQAEEQRDALAELGESTPEECVKFVELMDADPTIAAYQQQLAAMGRKPVIGEYNAAMEWMATADKRASEVEKREQARLACERLAAKT